MKVIDLLNKIANGEEQPEKIKFNGYEYSYHDKEHGYCRYNYDCTYICFDSEYYLFDILNDEIEIIEEIKKIEKLEMQREIEHGQEILVVPSEKEVLNKINEIIEV